MIIAKTVEEVRDAIRQVRRQGQRIGLVPTMGALHAGHYSLMGAAKADCPFVAVSIFVNPAQFGPNEDLAKYPRTLEADLAGCREHGVSLVFTPESAAMYAPDAATSIHVARLSEHLCGASRKGHFDGVCIVVAKLFNIVLPDKAYFGAKDYQQASVIGRMVRDLDMPLEIVVCPIIREADGLAMSSRNRYLSPQERQQALALIGSLHLADKLAKAGQRESKALIGAMRQHIATAAPLGQIDYIEVMDPDSLSPTDRLDGPVVIALAVKFSSARLIDNMRIDPTRLGG